MVDPAKPAAKAAIAAATRSAATARTRLPALRKAGTIEAGDHWILIGNVIDGGHRPGVAPMIFSRREYRPL